MFNANADLKLHPKMRVSAATGVAILVFSAVLLLSAANTLAATESEHAPAKHAAATDHSAPAGEANAAPHDSHPPLNLISCKAPSGNAPLLMVIFNFALLVGLLVAFGRKPLGRYLEQRSDSVKQRIDEATALKTAAQARLDEVEARIAKLDDEIAAIKERAQQEFERERKRMLDHATRESEQIAATAERTLTLEIERIRDRLEVQAIDAGLEAAEMLLRRSVSAEDAQRLHREQLASIETPNEAER